MLKAVRNMLIIILNIIFYAVVVFAGIQICRSGYFFAYDVLGETMAEMPPGTDKMLTVSENESVAQVLTDLQEKHLIKSKYSFYARLQLEEKINKKISAGVYSLNSSMSYGEIIAVLYPES
ncbi:MAG: endolytic transglycosylase MltG [Eubacterium sp.]|nr:endolytic transglycosylase MltG [Eubacterium sp.]